MPLPVSHCGLLTIRVDAIVRNWRRIVAEVGPGCQAAAVVKADAYGLGVESIAPALANAGCGTFFVASLEEAVRLRRIISCDIAVLNGLPGESAGIFAEHRLLPVLNNLQQVAYWAAAIGRARPAILQLDSGMSRLGLGPETLEAVPWSDLDLAVVMSHLACADEPNHPMNARQLGRFRTILEHLEPVPASLAASSGTFLGPAYHFNMVRPGAALYGINPRPGQPSPVEAVVRLQAPIIQTREIDTGEVVGYGASFLAPRRSRVATLGVGYADGYPRASGNHSKTYIADYPAPVIGRVSMDLLTLDVTDVPPSLCRPGTLVDLLGKHYGPDELARDSGTIGYEIMTSLGRRYTRSYEDGGTAPALALDRTAHK